jgi:subtilisin family serine protease
MVRGTGRGASRAGVVVVAAAIVLAAVTAGAAGTPDASSVSIFKPITNRYIVVFKDSVKRPGRTAERQTSHIGGALRLVYRTALRGYAAEMSAKAARGLANEPNVAYVEPDVRGGVAAQTIPTSVERTYASSNAELSINGSDDIRANADIAVIDSGIDYQHPDLDVVTRTDCSNNAIDAGDCVDGSGTDGLGHGTHVAGTIGAIDNGVGVVGVAPGARLWAVKVVDSGGFGSLSEYIAALDWVTAHADQIEVANSSLRYFTTSSQAFTDAMDASIEAGIVHVAAAGNENEAVQYVPGNHPEVITVSAVADYNGDPGGGASTTCANYGLDDRKASFSNYGSAVDIAAPGVCIYSTQPGNQYGYDSGTSMAAPHVAGAAAVVASYMDPSSLADVQDIRSTLINEGNSGWTDTSPDGIHEPLLDLSDPGVFRLGGWALRQPLNPGSSGDRLLFDVACDQTATAGCTVVGRHTAAGVATPVVQRNIGGSWSLQTAPVPGGTTQAAFDGVACPSGSSCIAVGGYQTAGSGIKPLADHWDGSSWSETSPPLRGSATSSFLAGAACSTTSACTAVGYEVVSGVRRPIAERWNGTTWTAQTVPPPAGATSSELYAVDCNSSTFCMAVGFYTPGAGQDRAFTAMWNGTSWTLKTIVEPAGTVTSSLHDVSCVGTTCKAVGGWQPGISNQYNLVQHWNGSAWSLETSPSNGQASVLQSVWCSTSTSCTAVGNFRTTVTSPIQTVAMRWNGTQWAIEPTPNPSGATFSALVGVSCLATSDTCRGVGWYTDSSGTKTLGEVRQ